MNMLAEAIGPEIGIYRDIPAEDYHRWNLPSNSILSQLARSPAHAKWAIDHGTTPTDSMELGTALHCLVLEPRKFREVYHLAGTCSAIKKGDGMPCTNAGIMQSGGEWFCGTHSKGLPCDPMKIVLSPVVWEKIHGMAGSVRQHPAAAKLLAIPGDTELSIVFRDPITEVIAKMRADRIATAADGRRVIIDLKTTEDANGEYFPRSIYNFGYHRQASLYLRGAAAVGIPCEAFCIIAVEKTPPYAVGAYKVVDQALDAGSEEVTRLLRQYDACERANHWPGYSDSVVDISLPPWAFKKIDERNADAE